MDIASYSDGPETDRSIADAEENGNHGPKDRGAEAAMRPRPSPTHNRCGCPV